MTHLVSRDVGAVVTVQRVAGSVKVVRILEEWSDTTPFFIFTLVRVQMFMPVLPHMHLTLTEVAGVVNASEGDRAAIRVNN